ncbi:MAG: UDP-galactopyranose mutase [Lachnospiraceae bacterium]|nr:UDP-galactopyranose mutase [Lachnospiraceae bacterium]
MYDKLTRDKYDLLIAGAGLYGSVIAHEAARAGRSVLVLEKRNHIGGNIYTERREGIDVHVYGAHIFHTSDRGIWEYVNSFAEFEPFINSPLARFRDELYNLPFNMNTFSRMWNIRTPDEAKRIIEEQIRKSGITKPENLEEQAISLVGYDIYEKLVKGYTEKQWGRKCSELPAFIIRRLPVRFTYDNNYFNDRYQGIPSEGYTVIAERMLKDADVLLNTDYFEFIKTHRDIAAKTVFTGMIDEFFGYSEGHLEYRSLRFETETLDTDNFQGNAVVNYTSADVPYTRIIEHRHFMNRQQAKTIISREYPQEWKPGKEPYYPVNDERNTELYEKYLKKAQELPDVVFGGRLGEYRYYDMDKVIAAALEQARAMFGQEE